jgi:hypothetical protein
MKYYISSSAEEKAQDKFSIDYEELEKMAEFSAPVTHRLGNRRYESYILQVQKGGVVDINRADAPRPTEIICRTCEGDGGYCLPCKSKGTIVLR